MMATEEKANETDTEGYSIVSAIDFYNLLQQRIHLLDVRSAEQYKLHHVSGAVNEPDPKNLKTFDQSVDARIVVYGDKSILTKATCEHLYSVAKSLKKHKKFAIFQEDFIAFYNKYSFLCQTTNANDTDEHKDTDMYEQTVYPSMILKDRLFLGDGFMAEDAEIMTNLEITHIVNVTPCHFALDKTVQSKIKYLQLSIDDNAAESIATYFEKAIAFIDAAFALDENNRVFVHCMAGVSRSASIIIAYMMKSQKYTLNDAYLWTKTCRPKISPNSGFYAELIAFEKKLFGKSTQKQLGAMLGSEEWQYNSK